LAAMGIEIIALELTVANEGTSNWQLNSNTIGIGDQFGRSYGRVNCDRTAQSLTAFPELPEIVEAGETRTGVVAISVWPGAELVDVFFVVGETRMFVIGHADPAITIGADEAREMVARSAR
jgi:hypothetical protein